jgi:alpha-galactosidase
MANEAKTMGIELFVLDDGWFGARNDDLRGLGDWVVNRTKLPHGLDGLAAEIHALGMRLGLWIEPEMVNADSDLYREHPDWAVGIPGRKRTESRQQLVLDFSRPEVVDRIATEIEAVLASAPIDYVKWDWNRFITEPFSPSLPPERQGEFFHRYALGMYELYRRLVTRFPGILFESCASGGARFDAGMLAWAPQAWTSDDTDAVERLAIQWGSSLAYPVSSMGAHVSAIPNHQTGRLTPLDFRAAVAMFGAFGYELDPMEMSPDEREAVRHQVAFYIERRDLFQRGRFLRLRSPFEGDGNETAWMVVAPDGSHAIAAHYRVLQRPLPKRDRLRLRGLDPAARYVVTVWSSFDAPQGTFERGGDELMTVGIGIEPPELLPAGETDGIRIVRSDFGFRMFDLRRV